jgi:gamma-glutamyl hercynylcysteine S-oxide synthase
LQGDELPTAVDVQYAMLGETHPQRDHAHVLNLPALRMHTYPVSKGEYAAWLNSTRWRPVRSQNWLADWEVVGERPGAGSERQPVTWVSRDDAVAYCAHFGMRLPTSYEWQYAAQSGDGRKWPWGDEEPDETQAPIFTSGRTMPPADDVDAHPRGASPFGLMDMVGNVYQWTDAFEDDHTVRAVLRGSSRWRPSGSDWYLPRPTSLEEHSTFLLVSDSLDRSAGIGFRCVAGGHG